MPINKVWEATLTQSWGDGGEQMMNRSFFTSDSVGANSAALHDAYTEPLGLLDPINGIQGNFVKNVSLRIINLGDLGDFSELGLSGAGVASTGELLPMHSAINYSLKLNTRAVRPGSKRFSGIPEAYQVNGLITDAGYITPINTLSLALANPITDGTAIFDPIVVKRIGLPTPGTPPYSSYRLPETDLELVFGLVVAAIVNLHISHQVSRGNGR